MEHIKEEINENTKNDLLNFIETTRKYKNNSYCNIVEYEKMKKYFPNFEQLLSNDQLNYTNLIIIEDDSENLKSFAGEPTSHQQETTVLQINDNHKSTINEFADRIQECLMINDHLSDLIINDLSNLEIDQLKALFHCLSTNLTMETLQKLHKSLILVPESIMEAYVHYLIISNMKRKFSYEIQNILISIIDKHSHLLIAEICKEFSNIDREESNQILLQYIINLDNNFQQLLLSNFSQSVSKLHESHISIINTLLKFPICTDTLNNIINHMFNSAMDFPNNVLYGKLLFKIIQNMESFGMQFEQPLKYILNIHQSIWKIKAKKFFVKYCPDDTYVESLA